MASIRTARVLAAVAAVPLTVALFSGFAAADTGALAGDAANAGVASVAPGAAGSGGAASSPTQQQQAVGEGARNTSTTVNISDSAVAGLGHDRAAVLPAYYSPYSPLWAHLW